jgi:predicted transcriptional regulator
MPSTIPIVVNKKISSVASVLRSLSDNKSLELFNIIASASLADADHIFSNSGQINSQLLISQVNLTRKQYYSRISTLISSGLVKRANGKYLPTSLGKVVYKVNALIDQAIQDHWKLKAIDALESKSSSGIPDEEREKIVNMLIDNSELKVILASKKSIHDEINEQIISSEIKSSSVVAKRPASIQLNRM